MKLRISGVFLIAACFLMMACSVYDDHLYGPDGEQVVRLSFVLALGSSDNSLTKTETWDPDDSVFDGDDIGYDPKMIGSSYDNMLDPATLQIVFYEDGDNDGNGIAGGFVGSLQITNYYPVDEEGNRVEQDDEGMVPEGKETNLYHIEGRLLVDESFLDAEDSYKMMAFANFPESQRDIINAKVPYTGLEELCFTSFAAGGKEKDTSFIPMWGVKTVKLDFSTDDFLNLETIYILRSMAKVEVRLGSHILSQGYSLTRLSVINANPQGYCLPGEALEVDFTEELSLTSCFRELESGIFVNPSVVNDSGVTSMVIYVPEKDNTSATAQPSSIRLRLNHIDEHGVTTSVEPSEDVLFVNYVSGRPDGAAYDISRNHNYVFEINNLFTETDGLKFLVTIKDLENGGTYGFVYN